MRAVEFIRHIRDGEAVSADDVGAFVRGICEGTVPDYQAAAYLMAVYLKGQSDEATVATTLAMRDSGRVIDLSGLTGAKVDKHSTGGVGDKISLPLAPWVASCGVRVPMISGRGLGHTGGTLDKAESIPGFRCDVDGDQFVRMVHELGVCLAGQTADLVPADKKLYSLRDVTSTIESVPLITASILSKKLAEGINALVLDVKVGRGAFMKDLTSARELAESLVRVGTGAGLKVTALLTRMDEPLGRMVGNALEIRESIEILQGVGPQDSSELTLALGAEMIVLAGIRPDREGARELMKEKIVSGEALARFQALIEAQGGDGGVIDDPDRLPSATRRTEVITSQSGVIGGIDAFGIGTAATALGAGRAVAEDVIDPAVGIELVRTCGERVEKGDVLAIAHHNSDLGRVHENIHNCFDITDSYRDPGGLVIDRICS